jgi:hypothetical protein
MEAKTLNEIRKQGLEVLAEGLGSIEMVRFIQSFDLGKGDYTKERFQWLDQSMDEIVREIEDNRTKALSEKKSIKLWGKNRR